MHLSHLKCAKNLEYSSLASLNETKNFPLRQKDGNEGDGEDTIKGLEVRGGEKGKRSASFPLYLLLAPKMARSQTEVVKEPQVRRDANTPL